MFYKNNLRPQMAFAGASSSSAKTAEKRRIDSMTFNTGSAESADFGAFGSEPERRNTSARGRGPKKKKFDGINLKDPKTLTIAAIAAVLALAIFIGGVILLFANLNLSGNVLYDDNAYIAYKVGDQTKVIANGKVIGHDFEGDEVELVPAKDNSFAYVFDYVAADEIYMYIIKGTKIEQVSDRPASAILAYAGLKPGIVFEETTDGGTTRYNLYNERLGTKSCAKVAQDPDHFNISDDAQTVVYTTKKDDSADRTLTVYEDEQTGKIPTSTSAIPVAVSKNGKYVYNVRTNVETGTMLYITDIAKGESYDVPNSQNFLCIVDMNVKGDEVLFCTGAGLSEGETATVDDVLAGGFTDVKTSLYRHKAPEDHLTTLIGKNVVVTANKDKDVAIYKTFLDKYLTTKLPDGNIDDKIFTYYLSKKYETPRVGSTTAEIEGQFSPDGKYFYFVNDHMELKQVNLKERTVKNIYDDGEVANFAVTEKGNLFILDTDDKSVYYYKISTKKSPRYDQEVDSMSFHHAANKVYFTAEDAGCVWIAEEGKEESTAKFGSTELKTLPYFSVSYGDKCYAVVRDPETDALSIYYSSNGRKFKQVVASTECDEIIFGMGDDFDME